MSALIDEAKTGSMLGKKLPLLSRTEVDAKFKSRGVSPKMIRDKFQLNFVRSRERKG